MKRKTAFLVAALAIAMFAAAAPAEPLPAYTTWTGGNADWATPGNWNSGLPNSVLRAVIDNGATVTIDTTGNTADRFYLGNVAGFGAGIGTGGTSGYIIMNSGDLTMTGAADYVGYGVGGSGTFTLNDGTFYPGFPRCGLHFRL